MGTLGTLTPERWRRIQEVLDAFDDLPPAARAGFLDAAGREDPELRRQVEVLLANDDQLDELLEKPVFPICTEKLDDGLLVPRIGPYKLIRELGQGGMGTVYLASQAQPFRRHVALKLIQPDVDSRDSIRRFHGERQILARIRHPNVAQLYDGGTTPDGRPYFAMEYVEGSPIHEYCDAHRLTVRQRLELMLQVCSAVHLAHQKLRVVHRDLKPSNILVTEDGIPKLLDFGIAKAVDVDGLEPGSAAGSASVWVPHYSSPEQLAGLPLTTASDIYSLGVLLYRLLTGRLPFRPGDARPESVRRAMRDQPLEKPSTAVLSTDSRIEGGAPLDLTPEAIGEARGTRPGKLSRHLAGDVDAIVLKALTANPEDRYPSVDSLAKDIRRHLQHLPIEARKHSFGYVAGKLVRRYRIGLAALTVILFTVATSIWTVLNEKSRSEQSKARAQRTVELLDNLITVFDPNETTNRMTPVEFLNHTRRRISDDLYKDPELLAELLSGSLAKVYRQLGHLDETESVLSEASVIFRNLHPGDHPKTAKVLNNLGAVYFRQGRYEGAMQFYREAYEMRQRLGFSDAELVASKSNLAASLGFQNHFEEAEELYLQILKTLEGLDEESTLIRNLLNFGMMYFAWNKYGQAEPLLRSALEKQIEAHGFDSPEAAALRSSLGRVLFAKGDLEAAEQALMQALDTQRLRLEPGHVSIARSERNLAAVMIETGNLATAGVLLANAQAPLRRTKPEDDYEIAELESLLGSYLTEIGNYEVAETCLIDSLRILHASKGPEMVFTKQAAKRVERLYQVWGNNMKRPFRTDKRGSR